MESLLLHQFVYHILSQNFQKKKKLRFRSKLAWCKKKKKKKNPSWLITISKHVFIRITIIAKLLTELRSLAVVKD